MRRTNPYDLTHDTHIWVPFVDVLLIVVAGLILRDLAARTDGGKRDAMYRGLENVHLVQASSDGGSVPDAADVIKLDSSGKVLVRGRNIELAELPRYLVTSPFPGHYVVAVDDNARAGDAQRIELILKEGRANYTRLFRHQPNPKGERQ